MNYKPAPMEYAKLSINDVELDFDNPRIKQYIEIYDGQVTSEGLALALSAAGGESSNSSAYGVLKESIKSNGGIIHPIIVNKRDDGRMIVIEGNTRLQIYKEFAESAPNGPWQEIIAIVYFNMSDEQIHAIRLQSHLVGPRDWDPFSKAKYLYQLSEIDKLPMNVIVSYCGGKTNEITKLIAAYKDMMEYYVKLINETGNDIDPRDFSKFVEGQNKKIYEALVKHKYTKEDFAKWVVKGNIDTAQNVRKLPDVLGSSKAKSVFLKKNITEAYKYVEIPTDKVDLSGFSMYDLAKELTLRFDKIEFKEVTSLRSNPSFEDKKETIIELFSSVNSLIDDLEEE